MNIHLRHNGFIKPTITSDHYILGGGMIPKIIIRADRQWTNFLPDPEKQFNSSFDTFGCTVFGTLNALEVFLTAIGYRQENKSDRCLYIFSDTHPPGNDPHVVSETIRNVGVVPESDLPFSPEIDTLEKFTALTDWERKADLVDARKWLQTFEYLHEWVFESGIPLAEKQKRIWECLQYSPIGASVRAWAMNDAGLYCKQPGEEDNHWTVIVGGVFGEYWIIFDTYPDDSGLFLKKLAWDYDFGFAKRYHVEQTMLTPEDEKSVVDDRPDFWEAAWDFIKSLIAKLKP